MPPSIADPDGRGGILGRLMIDEFLLLMGVREGFGGKGSRKGRKGRQG